jgi:SMI1/KNR4 family protein SUKH-1
MKLWPRGRTGHGPATLKDVMNYFRSYDQRTFQVVACQGREPSEADVAAFERDCGFRLPAEFREFTMSPLGGLYMEVREELWPRPTAHSVGPFWSFLYAVKVFGIAEGIPDWLDIRAQYAALQEEGVSGLVPFLQRECDANRYCFDARGRIVHWDHEEPEERAVAPSSFPELLMTEIRGLEERARKKIAGED